MDKSLQVVVMYLLSHIGLIFFMYPKDIIESLHVGHWIAIVLGFAFHVGFLSVYLKGLSYFTAHSVIDIFWGVGKIFAVILLFPVTLYFLMIMIITVRAYSEIIMLVFLGNTPLWAIMILLLGVSLLISAQGIEPLLRTGLLIAFLFLPLLIFVLCVSFQNADWRYVFPLLDEQAASLSFIISQPYLLSFFAFAGGFMFLGFTPPHIPYKRQIVLRASVLLLPFFLVSVYVPLLTFGQNTASQFQFPFITAVDTVEIRWLMFDRVTMFFMISLICFVLLFLSLVMWKTSLLIRRGVPWIKPIPLYLLLTITIFVVCLMIQDWKAVERLFWWNTYLRLYTVIVIPLITLVLGIRHHRKGAASA
ncbi:spore germination protein [Paenibacillus sp. P26]|nr:spore germination protein [Paenibacillus sp. P26]UUZ95338.1 spore germination protein [Paenibacillus sp. P25]